MVIKVKISDETWARMQQGKRVEGTLGLDKWTGEKTFNAFNRKSSVDRPKDETLYETASGWLKASVKKNKIFVSVNRKMGNGRCASELMLQARELTDHLRNIKSIEEIMDNI
jgi:hypothetical protein